VVGHLVAVVEESARRVRQDPTTDLEVTPRPYAVQATSPTRTRFGRFCYALYVCQVGRTGMEVSFTTRSMCSSASRSAEFGYALGSHGHTWHLARLPLISAKRLEVHLRHMRTRFRAFS
jgi:hypothetical protein